MNHPIVSIIMNCYNGESFLKEAVDSVIAQTYPYWELIFWDNQSDDQTKDIIDTYHDERIKYFCSDIHTSLGIARVKAMEQVRGDFVAFLDADDIWLPQKLEKQIALFKKRPDIGVCGTWHRYFGNLSITIKAHTQPDIIYSNMVFGNSLAISSVMIRRFLLTQFQLTFDPDFSPAEDFDLWEKLARHTKLYNLSEVLLLYRSHDHQTSESVDGKKTIDRNSLRVCERVIQQLGIHPTDQDLRIHAVLSGYSQDFSEFQLWDMYQWLVKLEIANQKINLFPQQTFQFIISQRWFIVVLYFYLSDMLKFRYIKIHFFYFFRLGLIYQISLILFIVRKVIRYYHKKTI